jgi:hypothetical protein
LPHNAHQCGGLFLTVDFPFAAFRTRIAGMHCGVLNGNSVSPGECRGAVAPVASRRGLIRSLLLRRRRNLLLRQNRRGLLRTLLAVSLLAMACSAALIFWPSALLKGASMP